MAFKKASSLSSKMKKYNRLIPILREAKEGSYSTFEKLM